MNKGHLGATNISVEYVLIVHTSSPYGTHGYTNNEDTQANINTVGQEGLLEGEEFLPWAITNDGQPSGTHISLQIAHAGR
jgi:hypothetical protein